MEMEKDEEQTEGEMAEVSVGGKLKICREPRAREGRLGVIGVEGPIKTERLDGTTLVDISHVATVCAPSMALSAARRPAGPGVL